MKKQFKPACPAGRKLTLTKRTIVNLEANEMSNHLGGAAHVNKGGQMKTRPFTKRCQGW